jgi:hypothetical protein
MFSKMARTMLRGIRVTSKQELIDRIHLYLAELNADSVIFRWKYKMDEAGIVQLINRTIISSARQRKSSALHMCSITNSQNVRSSLIVFLEP